MSTKKKLSINDLVHGIIINKCVIIINKCVIIKGVVYSIFFPIDKKCLTRRL